MKVTSVLEQGHVIFTIEIHVVCKTEKRNFGKLYFRKKKVKGTDLSFHLIKQQLYKNYIKTFSKPNLKRISSELLYYHHLISQRNILSMCFIHVYPLTYLPIYTFISFV